MEDTDLPTHNEITRTGKTAAGVLLIAFTLLPLWLIMAYWPDRIPNAKEPIKPLYLNRLYQIRLLCISEKNCDCDTIFLDTCTKANIDNNVKQPDTGKKAPAVPPTTTDSPRQQIDKPDETVKPSPAPEHTHKNYYLRSELIDLSTLILILVAAGGFLGNMIHIATSFTTFVGAGSFKRNWILWYCVKPFTAAALALGLYFVFRGGFMNYSADPSSVNLYGILTIALLTGLFTDRATLKLGEVFDVLFSIKKDLKNDDPRPDKLKSTPIKIISVQPDQLEKEKQNIIIVQGENLDKQSLILKINNQVIAANVIKTTPTTITIHYAIPTDQESATEFKLQILDNNNQELFYKIFTI